MNSNQDTIEQLRWKKFPVGSDGFVCLVDAMGADEDIVTAARTSYLGGQTLSEELDTVCQKMFGIPYKDCSDYDIEQACTKIKADGDKLLRYLLRHNHTTPFEMAEIKFLVRVPMDTWRQWIRHRTANVNEYSTRYAEAIDSRQETSPDAWRLQAKSNKQGSSGLLTEWPSEQGSIDCAATYKAAFTKGPDVTPGDYLSAREFDFHKQANDLYQERLQFGVAKEQARKDLPLSTYTEAYWKCDLHNIFNFLRLRMDSHAQQEIRDYANVMGAIVKELYPVAWQAFEDYKLEAVTLTRLDKIVLRDITQMAFPSRTLCELTAKAVISDKREFEECVAKLTELGVIPKE